MMTLREQILPTDVLERLRHTDKLWKSLRCETPAVPLVIQESPESLGLIDTDVVISGGTLGILIAAALQRQGWRVTLLEKGDSPGKRSGVEYFPAGINRIFGIGSPLKNRIGIGDRL